MRRLNHSRHIDVYARDIGNAAYQKAKTTPTAKQIKFYTRLYAMCKENSIDTKTREYTKTRAEYAIAIDKLLKRLQEAGIDAHGNGKNTTYVLTHGSDRRGRYYIDERIEVRDDQGESGYAIKVVPLVPEKTGCALKRSGKEWS